MVCHHTVYTNSLLAVLNVRHFVLESKRSKFPSFKSAIPLSKVKRRVTTYVELSVNVFSASDSAHCLLASEHPDYVDSYASQQQSVLPTVITISTDVVRDSGVQAAKDAAVGYVKSTAW